MKRRRKRHLNRKPIGKASVAWGCLGIASVLTEAAILTASVFLEDLPRAVGGIGVIASILVAWGLLQSIKLVKDDNFRKESRVFGVVATAAALLLWIALYALGLAIG